VEEIVLLDDVLLDKMEVVTDESDEIDVTGVDDNKGF